MFEYASMHNACKLHVMLDSNVMKTHFRKKKICTCHILVMSCYIPVIDW
jgi:hypothetical protein